MSNMKWTEKDYESANLLREQYPEALYLRRHINGMDNDIAVETDNTDLLFYIHRSYFPSLSNDSVTTIDEIISEYEEQEENIYDEIKIPLDELPKVYATELTNGLKVGDSVWEVHVSNEYIDCPVCEAKGKISYAIPNWPKYKQKPDSITCPCCSGFKHITRQKKATVVGFKIHQIDLSVEISEDGMSSICENLWLDGDCIRCFDESRDYISKAQAEKVCAEKNKEFGYAATT